MSKAVLLVRWTADSKDIHKLITLLIVSLIDGAFEKNLAAAVSHKHSQLHNCVQLRLFQKNKKQQQIFLPVFEPLNMSGAAIPQMAGGEGREGQLFNPLQCKHDLFEW